MKEEQEFQQPRAKRQKSSGFSTPKNLYYIPPILPSTKISTPNTPHQSAANHRPVTSCSHCRQHKIKCDAHQKFPAPCSRCTKYGLHCEIDPQFKPKKGSQLQVMRKDLDDLKIKVNYLLNNESVFSKQLNESTIGRDILHKISQLDEPNDFNVRIETPLESPYANNLDQEHSPIRSNDTNTSKKISAQTYLVTEPALINKNNITNVASDISTSNNSTVSPITNENNIPNDGISTRLQNALQRDAQTDNDIISNAKKSLDISNNSMGAISNGLNNIDSKTSPVILTTETLNPLPSPYTNVNEFVLGDVHISMETATRLYTIFVNDYLPYFPIMFTNSVTELHSQSQLLFWTVMLTASLSDPEPDLYTKLSVLIKHLAMETCWMRTPRSTHITQALLILCIWPLPSQKVLDDCSYRFVGLAKSLSYQLGLHRGEFITEFTRSQTSMPNAEKWRTRTWLGIFIAELCWASILGLPPTSQKDHLVENALKCEVEDGDDGQSSSNGIKPNEPYSDVKETNDFKSKCTIDTSHPKFKLPYRFKNLISLSSFQVKLYNVMGSSVTSPDGLLDPKERANALSGLDKELDAIASGLNFEENPDVHIYYLYVRLTVYCFAFLPETPIEHQSQHVTDSYLCATKIVTLITKLLETHQLISLPIYIRQSATFSALILFKLQLTPLLPNQFLNSARQSIVTIHRLFRNQLTAWVTVENDISRTASMLEKLNLVLITHSEVFIEESGVISKMRSHLTGSLFYDLVWCVHEARRREMDPKYNEAAIKKALEKRKANNQGKDSSDSWDRRLYPLPLYNHITRDDFKTITQTTPGGTTVTTLVPTKTALKHAEESSKAKNNKDGFFMEINGIPLFMLDETGSVKIDNNLLRKGNLDIAGSHATVYLNNRDSLPHNSRQEISNGPESNHVTDSFNSPNSDLGNYYSTKNNNGIAPLKYSAQTTKSNSTTRSSSNTESLFNNKTVSTKPKIFKPKDSMVNTASSNKEQYSNLNNLNSFLNNEKKYTTQAQSNNGNESKNSGNLQNYSVGNDTTFSNPINDFFQQQGAGWIEGNLSNDDFFGWLDMNMEPEF